MLCRKQILPACVVAAALLTGCQAQDDQAATPTAVAAEEKAVPQKSGQTAPARSKQLKQDQTAGSLEAVIAGEHRSAASKARDQYRHPADTLEFFEVEPDMTVVEIWPGGGWYTEILGPWLRDNGQLYAAGFALSQEITPDYRRNFQRKFEDKLAASPGLYDKVQVTELGPTQAWNPAPPGEADRVLTFRNVHNWVKGDYHKAMFNSFYRSLKPGGILGIVEHRASAGTDLATMKESGYVTEKFVKQAAAAAGFEFVAASEINANPADDHDHPEGVWSLPPSLRGGDVDRQKYLDIGESDRMTLKFRKPLASTSPDS